MHACRFVYAGNDSPGPGKYYPRYGAQDRDVHAPDMAKLPGFSTIDAKAEAFAARKAATSMGGAGDGGQDGAATHRSGHEEAMQEGTSKRSASPGPTDPAAAGRQGAKASSAPTTATGLHSDGMTIAGAHPVDAMFAEAHRVRPKSPAKAGTSAFKVVPRPSPCMETTAGHLAGAYWHEEIDK